MTKTKPSNPKDIVGSTTKVPMSYLPIPVMMEAALGMFEGGSKYGRHNYRAVGVRGSVYFDATLRHLFDWWEGEDYDPDSVAKLHHISKAISSLCVIRDSMLSGNFVDDRPPTTMKTGWMQELNNKVPLIIEEHKDKDPRHYTISDEVNTWDCCPLCGELTDNGHDRSIPPIAYACSKCDPDNDLNWDVQ